MIGFCSKHFFVLMMAFIMVACSSAADKKRQHQADLYFGAGTQSLVTKDYTDALKNLLKANEMDPNNPGILNNLGMAYYFKEEKDMALKMLKRSIEIDENNSDAKVNLASIYYRDGNINDAEKIYKQVLKDLTYEKQARTLYNLGIIELKKMNKVSAENYFKKAVKEDENYCPGFFQLGLVQYERRDFNKALKNFKEASMGTCMEFPAAHYYQGLTLSALKRYDEARMKYDEIDARFKQSEFAVKARTKSAELNELKTNNAPETFQASRNVLESPEF